MAWTKRTEVALSAITSLAVIVPAGLILAGYAIPYFAPFLYSGDGKFRVEMSELPYFAAYSVDFPEASLAKQNELQFTFQHFATTNAQTWLDWCFKNETDSTFADVPNDIRLSFSDLSGQLYFNHVVNIPKTLDWWRRRVEQPGNFYKLNGQFVDVKPGKVCFSDLLSRDGQAIRPNWARRYRVILHNNDNRAQDTAVLVSLNSGPK